MTRRLAVALGISLLAAAAARPNPESGDAERVFFEPKLQLSESQERFERFRPPGSDAFPEEKQVAEIQARLDALGARLRESPGAMREVRELLLAPGFPGGRMRNATRVVAEGTLQVAHAPPQPDQERSLDAAGFVSGLAGLVEGFSEIRTAEFLITAFDLDAGTGTARADVRYDLTGSAPPSGRLSSVGLWETTWRSGPDGWRVAEWNALETTRSLSDAPLFAEVTAAAFGDAASFREQLSLGLDAWMATIDAALTRDSNGHHGVSVGDADGDGIEDLYVSQPAGLPNRLYLGRADGRFEDATERAGLAVLDDTAHAVFADVDNDGDQDLILSTASGPGLFTNDGTGRYRLVTGAFQFQGGLQGAPMSLALADYDRDGDLDVYLCVYSFYYGAGEDKAGTPMPYYDARNGPPSVLFRNEGGSRFVDVTREAGLDPGNDRYSFAAAWADYDEDGWIDLLVANDFGRKNLYRNLGPVEGTVRFRDVAAEAGVEDHGAGMSATWLDSDNDGRLDAYVGNMWSDAGLRITSQDAFMSDAPEEVRRLYRRHARGNSLFRGRSDGSFEDVSVPTGAHLGRWAWSSDALDFDSDGWEDLYVVNGMLTRERGGEDLDGFFWRQVVARSPASRVTGTPYDEAWRAINQLLVKGSIASRQRNVLLRNDGGGGYDDVSGAVGLDLDQDGRSFAVFDYERDGDPDLALMAARGAPQLRLLRNDFAGRRATLAVRLVGSARAVPTAGSEAGSNRDGVGARVSVETDRLRRTRVVLAASGFLSQGSKELLFGLGASESVRRLTVRWPSGLEQSFADVPLNHRLVIAEGGEPSAEPLATPRGLEPDAGAPVPARAPSATWLYHPAPAPDFSLPDLEGTPRSLAALRGGPAALLLWSSRAPASVAALASLSAGAPRLASAGVGAVALSLDSPEASQRVRDAAAGATGVPAVHASESLALSYAILNRHLYMNRQDLELPTLFLLDRSGNVVRAYRGGFELAEVVDDAARIAADAPERLARALPFPGTLQTAPGGRPDLPLGRELLEQGLESAALVAFERAAEGDPSPGTLYRLGTLLSKSGQPARAKAVFERALALDPELAEASNDLGALLAQDGDLARAMERFREALRANPDYPDALNNLGYALLLSGRRVEARELYERALALQPDFPEALNNVGLILGQDGDIPGAEPYFRRALGSRPDYGEAANNLALALVSQGAADQALRLLSDFLEAHPDYEGTYVTLAKLHLSTGRNREGLRILERLLQRNPRHERALAMLREFR